MSFFKKSPPPVSIDKEYFGSYVRRVEALEHDEKLFVWDTLHDYFPDLDIGGLKRSDIDDWNYFFLYENLDHSWSVEATKRPYAEMEIISFEDFCALFKPVVLDTRDIHKLL